MHIKCLSVGSKQKDEGQELLKHSAIQSKAMHVSDSEPMRGAPHFQLNVPLIQIKKTQANSMGKYEWTGLYCCDVCPHKTRNLKNVPNILNKHTLKLKPDTYARLAAESLRKNLMTKAENEEV
jgi:hypothetical protein